MIAVDTNVLVAAHRLEAPAHDRASLWLHALAQGSRPWALPVFCISEFIRVVTHRRVFDPPSTLAQALGAVDSLLQSPSLRILQPTAGHWPLLRAAIAAGETAGNLVFDAQIAALCREHGIERLLTQDRDFSRFPFLATIPLEADPGRT